MRTTVSFALYRSIVTVLCKASLGDFSNLRKMAFLLIFRDAIDIRQYHSLSWALLDPIYANKTAVLVLVVTRFDDSRVSQ